MTQPFPRRRVPLSASLALILSPLFALSATAAPQIMAVASTDLKIPVTCDAGECSVELSSICLQEHRASPIIGTAYYVHGTERFELSGLTEQGQEIDLSHLKLDIKAARGHNAIKVGFREAAIAKYGPMTLQIAVPENVSVVPLPIANDIKPQTDEDIALATGPLRQIAHEIIDLDTHKRDAAELVNQTINRLPWEGRASDTERAAARAEFDGIVKASGFSGSARANANAVIEECYSRTTAGSLTFRQCLGSWHDRLVGKLNTQYWKSLKAGS